MHRNRSTLRKVCELALALALGGGLLQGCIVSPGDGMVVSDRDQRLRFSGYHPYRRAPVTMKAYNFRTGGYDVIAEGTSASTPIPASYWDDTLYAWSAPSRSLPAAYWTPGACTGWRAVVKGETEVGGRTYGMYSSDLEANAEGCSNEHRNNADWARNCASPSSTIRTRDFSDTPRVPDIHINGPDANGDCTGVEFRAIVPDDADFGFIGAELRDDDTGRIRSLACTVESRTARGYRVVACRLGLGGRDAVRRFIEQLRFETISLRFEMSDERCTGGAGRTFTSWVTRGDALYDYNWERWSGVYDQCEAPPPPPPPSDEGTSYAITCLCTQQEVIDEPQPPEVVPVEIQGCLDTSGGVSALINGSNALCTYLANDIARVDGIATSCVADAYRSLDTECRPTGSYFRR